MKKFLLLLCVAMQTISILPAEEPSLSVFTRGRQLVVVSSDGTPMLNVEPATWGPNFSWTDLSGSFAEVPGGVKGTFSGKLRTSDAVATFDVSLVPLDKRQIRVDATFQVDKPAETLEIMVVNPMDGLFGLKRGTLTDEAGTQTVVDLPFPKISKPDLLAAVQMADASKRVFEVSFSEKKKLWLYGGGVRVVLGEGKIEPGDIRRTSFTIKLPEDANMMLLPASVPSNSGTWFEWTATGHPTGESVLDMSKWLEAPAGKHGRVVRKGEQLLYNGKPMKFWGTNVCFSAVAPNKATADRQSALYSRYGINTIRLHKFADGPDWQGIVTAKSAVEYDPAKLDAMDYFVSKFKEKGIYTKLSSNFGRVPVGPDDLASVPFATEFPPMNNSGWKATPQGAVWYSKEIGDLQIAQMTRLLEHKNPYTGMRYADDPSIMMVEIVNENSSFFFTLSAMQNSATVKRAAGEAFFAWLKERYQTEEALVAAWGGPKTIGRFGSEKMSDESWATGLIYPVGGIWFFSPEQLDGPLADLKKRMLDTMLFMCEQEIKYYERFTKAVRDIGYQGEILGSNWVAARAYSHYMNLYADSTLGTIDRHNYFGGSSSMLSQPGGGVLSSGMIQVAGCTFMLSEWIHCFPNEFGVEGPAVIGAYGMGLNGWDVSYMFQNYDGGEFLKYLGKKEWEVITPQIIGIYPAVARQVYRGDVKEAELTFNRNVYFPGLVKGELGFEDKMSFDYDVKQYDSSAVPAKSLAIGRGLVNFTKEPMPTPQIDLTPYLQDNAVISSTKQLKWVAGKNRQDGHITINTPGTQAVVGFASGIANDLQDVAITSKSKYAAIYVTALDPEATIAQGKRLLISTIARAQNTGMKYVAGNLVETGKGPILVEPVVADIRLKRKDKPTINILDHNGVRTGKTLPVGDDGLLALDGNATKAVYYEAVYP
ncbi:MAG: hypothetical protein WCS65_12060 [Verrucomicrobiae bacterium]